MTNGRLIWVPTIYHCITTIYLHSWLFMISSLEITDCCWVSQAWWILMRIFCFSRKSHLFCWGQGFSTAEWTKGRWSRFQRDRVRTTLLSTPAPHFSADSFSNTITQKGLSVHFAKSERRPSLILSLDR